MTEGDGAKEPRQETGWERRRRLAAVFGEALPEITSDEKDPAEQGDGSDSAGDRWLKSQVPPHHG
jgi:hypothetical protein